MISLQSNRPSQHSPGSASLRPSPRLRIIVLTFDYLLGMTERSRGPQGVRREASTSGYMIRQNQRQFLCSVRFPRAVCRPSNAIGSTKPMGRRSPPPNAPPPGVGRETGLTDRRSSHLRASPRPTTLPNSHTKKHNAPKKPSSSGVYMCVWCVRVDVVQRRRGGGVRHMTWSPTTQGWRTQMGAPPHPGSTAPLRPHCALKPPLIGWSTARGAKIDGEGADAAPDAKHVRPLLVDGVR